MRVYEIIDSITGEPVCYSTNKYWVDFYLEFETEDKIVKEIDVHFDSITVIRNNEMNVITEEMAIPKEE